MRQERLLSVGTDGGGYINLLCTNKDDLSQDSCGNALTFGGGPTVASMHMGNRSGFDTLIFFGWSGSASVGPHRACSPPQLGMV